MKTRVDKDTLTILEDSLFEALSEIIDLEEASDEEVAQAYTRLLKQVQPELEEDTLSTYRKVAPKALKKIRKQLKGFEKRSFSRWKPAFDHIEMMWSIAQELGEMHAADIAEEGGEDNNVIMAALAHIFPRALLVTQEVICLLKGGFPDGALARWRSLHELCVTAMYIAKHGEEAALQYLLSFHFSARRAAKQVNEHAGRANLKRFTDEEMAEFDVLCASAENAIGRTISKDKFGEWPTITGTHPNFAEIEKNVGMDHWRPRYKWASTHTHANHKPIGTLLGMAESTTFVNLVGASNSGFVDPFLMTSITLSQITTTFLLIAPNPDRLVHANVMLRLADEMQTIAVETEKLTREAFKAVKPSRTSAPSSAASRSE